MTRKRFWNRSIRSPIGAAGKPLGDVERALLKEGAYRITDYVSNYRALLPSCERLRSSTYFIKDADGELLGFLTVNIRVEALLHTRNLLDSLINGCKLSHGQTGGRTLPAPRRQCPDAESEPL